MDWVLVLPLVIAAVLVIGLFFWIGFMVHGTYASPWIIVLWLPLLLVRTVQDINKWRKNRRNGHSFGDDIEMLPEGPPERKGP